MKVTLGGRAWELESLPWRLVKTMQPKFLALWSRLAGLGAANALKVSEADLERSANAYSRPCTMSTGR